MMYTARMFKHFLTAWLIISTLGYGSAWAFDNHLNDAEQHRVVDSDVNGDVNGDTGNAPDSGGDFPCCDGNCHSSAHIMGLSSYQSGSVYPDAGTGNTPYRQTLAFFATAPPLRPPQV